VHVPPAVAELLAARDEQVSSGGFVDLTGDQAPDTQRPAALQGRCPGPEVRAQINAILVSVKRELEEGQVELRGAERATDQALEGQDARHVLLHNPVLLGVVQDVADGRRERGAADTSQIRREVVLLQEMREGRLQATWPPPPDHPRESSSADDGGLPMYDATLF